MRARESAFTNVYEGARYFLLVACQDAAKRDGLKRNSDEWRRKTS